MIISYENLLSDLKSERVKTTILTIFTVASKKKKKKKKKERKKEKEKKRRKEKLLQQCFAITMDYFNYYLSNYRGLKLCIDITQFQILFFAIYSNYHDVSPLYTLSF